MKKITESTRRGDIRSCVMWREDIEALVQLFASYSNSRCEIISNQYEFESVEELFSKTGPRISQLRLRVKEPSIEVELRPQLSRFEIGNVLIGRPFANDASLEKCYSELTAFFNERRSLIPYISKISVVLIAVIVVAVAAAAAFVFLGNVQNRFAGVLLFMVAFGLTILALLAAVSVFVEVVLGGVADVRNLSKIKAQFSAHDRKIRNRDRFVTGAISAVITAIVAFLVQNYR